MSQLFWINPTINIFGLHIAWYALFILSGVICAVVMGIKEGRKLGISGDTIITGVCITLPIAIIGARLWYVLFNISNFHSFAEVLGFRGGKFVGLEGLAIQGGVIAAMITVYIYCRKRGASFFRIFDLVAPGFLIGQILGRFGNFCNHELFGPVVTSAWYAKFLDAIPLLGENMCFRVSAGGGVVATPGDLSNMHHPTFLYESLLNLVGLAIMLVSRRKLKKLESGDFIGFYLIWYGCVRIFTESLRMQSGVDDPLMFLGMPVSIVMSVVFIICGIAYLVLKRIFLKRENYLEILQTVKENKIDTVLFDLDGTLLNTRKLIDASFIHTFEHFRPEHKLTDEELDSFFGPTLVQSFSRYAKDEKECEEMIKYYREYNVSNHDSIVTVFPGALDIVRFLKRHKLKVGVVSSKKTDLVRHGLELFGLLKYMDIVVGSDEVKNHKPAPDGILLAKEKLGGKNVLYVGDTKGDIMAGKNANAFTCGVLYIKNPEIMLEVSPDFVINKLSELQQVVGV